MNKTAKRVARSSSRQSPVAVASFSPLYKQIKDLLLQSLESGEFKPGEMIPSEQELAVRFKVSQGTVRKAIDELSAENVLIRRQGKGTFVATHHEPEVRYRFLRMATDNPEGVKRTHSEILSCDEIEANDVQRQVFGLSVGQKVICIKRVMYLSHQPAVYEEIYLPEPAFQGLSFALLTTEKMPLYGLFESHFGVQLLRCDEKLRAVSAPKEVAKYLKIEEGSPLLSIERVAYTYGEKAMEIRKGLYLTEHYYYRNSLN
ncbi:GntR family transcriptional regulator [Pelistega europaea]|uniref:GntR family transcriptional regulator n=1 Tax=Pelistega europaea TaxID=106147 RepID=A0A7Y4LBC3_9BURK|nr:GntR family transcriptional regulator [Pelistega europaea]NOL49416.1 GntR family transcriptional regulator [Pelistega europaea]